MSYDDGMIDGLFIGCLLVGQHRLDVYNPDGYYIPEVNSECEYTYAGSYACTNDRHRMPALIADVIEELKAAEYSVIHVHKHGAYCGYITFIMEYGEVRISDYSESITETVEACLAFSEDVRSGRLMDKITFGMQKG